MTVFTVGHSTRTVAEFLALIEREGIKTVADVRRFPGSRRFPQFGREALEAELRAHGLDYVHFAELGGRRRPLADSPNGAWRNAQFRGYADHMASPHFGAALEDLIERGIRAPTVVMCAEAVPWRCHRSLLADALLVRDIEVRHILERTTSLHSLTPRAVVAGGRLTYPGSSTALEQPTLFDP